MPAVTLPLSLLETRRADSYRKHQQHQAARQKAEPELSRATAVRDRVDGWCNLVARHDDELADFAAHKKGLVVLDNLLAPAQNDNLNRICGELSFDPVSGQRSRAKLTLKAHEWNNETKLAYKRTGDKETYIEKHGDAVTCLIIDHAKGTLTYTERD